MMMTFFPAPRPAEWPSVSSAQKGRRANGEMPAAPSAAAAINPPNINLEQGIGAIEEIAVKKL
jgi:hypothetical protein